MLPVAIIRADAHKSAHIAEKHELALNGQLTWRKEGPHHFVADTNLGGAYVVRRVDSGSRVKRQQYRWKALWVPADDPNTKELALEKRADWSKAAAEVHYQRQVRYERSFRR